MTEPRVRYLVLVLFVAALAPACTGSSSDEDPVQWCLDHPPEVIGMRDNLGLLGDWEVWLEERGVNVDSAAPPSEQDLAVFAELEALVNHPDPATADANRVSIRVDWLTSTPDGVRSCQAAYDAR